MGGGQSNDTSKHKYVKEAKYSDGERYTLTAEVRPYNILTLVEELHSDERLNVFTLDITGMGQQPITDTHTFVYNYVLQSAEAMRQGTSLACEFLCRWQMKYVCMLDRPSKWCNTPHSVNASLFYGVTHLDEREPDFGTMVHKIVGGDDVVELHITCVRLGSRSLIGSFGRYLERVYESGIDVWFNNDALSDNDTEYPELRLQVRRTVHFHESAADRLYSLVKRASLLQEFNCHGSATTKRLLN